MKHLVAALVLTASATAGCGGGEPPDDASQQAFCDNFNAIIKDLGSLGDDAKETEMVRAIKSAGEKLAETGTPKDIPDDARQGFELELQKIDDLDDDASQQDLARIDSGLSDDERQQVDAFNKYVGDTCGRADGP